MKKGIMLLGVVILLIGVFLIVPSFAEQILKIGSFNPRTGPGAFWGMNADRGVYFSVEEWNKKGGVSVKGPKYRIEMIHEDDKYKGEEAVKAANKLIFTDKVKFIVGPLSSAAVLAAQPIIEANKVIMICNTYAGRELLKDKLYTFRVMQPPIHFSPAFFKLLTERLPNLKTCVHISPNDATGWGSTQGDNDACHTVGIKVLASEFFEVGTQDFTPLLTRIMALSPRPDFLSMGGTATGYTALVIKQARELGYKGMFVHTGQIHPNDIGPIAGWESIEGFVTTHLSMEGPLCPPGVKKIGTMYEAKYKEAGWEVNGALYGALYYDYPNILLRGIEKANSLNPDEVRVAIENLGEIDTITGKGRWGGKEFYGINHQLIWPLVISQVQNRKLVVIGVVMPWEMPAPQQKWR